MKVFLIAFVCLACSAPALAQAADEPATRDDVILYLRARRTHDMMRKMMDAMAKSMREMSADQSAKDNNQTTADFEAKKKKRQEMVEDMRKGMPMDEITQAMIPTYQKHFTRSDIAAMNAFYSSPARRSWRSCPR